MAPLEYDCKKTFWCCKLCNAWNNGGGCLCQIVCELPEQLISSILVQRLNVMNFNEVKSKRTVD